MSSGLNANSFPVALNGRSNPEFPFDMHHQRILFQSLFAVALLSLAACGGDAAATIGGSVTGLANGSTLALEDNASTADPVSVAGDGTEIGRAHV